MLLSLLKLTLFNSWTENATPTNPDGHQPLGRIWVYTHQRRVSLEQQSDLSWNHRSSWLLVIHESQVELVTSGSLVSSPRSPCRDSYPRSPTYQSRSAGAGFIDLSATNYCLWPKYWGVLLLAHNKTYTGGSCQLLQSWMHGVGNVACAYILGQ